MHMCVGGITILELMKTQLEMILKSIFYKLKMKISNVQRNPQFRLSFI